MSENTQQTQNQYAQPPPQNQRKRKEKNVIGIIAFIVAVVGFIFACIPGALILGWVLLPAAFVLGLVALFMKDKGKSLGITAIIVSIVGTIVGFVVFFSVVASSFDEAFGTGDSEVIEDDNPAGDKPKADDEKKKSEEKGDEGKRSNPHPIGTKIKHGDWEFTLNSVNLDATEEIANENQFNDPPADGNVYIVTNVTSTYLGDDEDGMTAFPVIEFVAKDGNSYGDTESMAVAPDQLDIAKTLYNGGSVTGNIVLEVPTDSLDDGVLAVIPNTFGKKTFYAIK
jgi:hypothetical protein